jgi:hypothetical protein
MPAHSRSKNGVASLAYVAGIHVFGTARKQDVDGRDKPGHDGCEWARGPYPALASSTACSEMRDQPEILSRKAV